MKDMTKVKLFLAIYFPTFITLAIVLRKSPYIYPVGYALAGVTLLALGWLIWALKFRKKKK
jgi:hypothetical protein